MKLFAIITAICICNTVCSQTSNIVVQNSKDQKGTINVKWYSQQFTYPEGVNIYRMELPSGNWNRLNNYPVTKLGYLDTSLFASDKDLRMFVQLLKDSKPEDLKSFVIMNLVIKTIQSSDFARFAGIQYDDAESEPGKKYRYKIMQIINGKEEPLGESAEITAGEFSQLAPPQEVFVRNNKKVVEMGWRCEDERFYATNIYRFSEGDSKKLNNRPVLISMYQDSSGNQKYPEVKFKDKDIITGINYNYRICGIDLFGNETVCSDTFNIFLTDKEPPIPPDSLMFDVENLKVNLYWRINKTDDLKGFNIYRGNSSTKYSKVNAELLPAKTNSYIDNVPVADGYYYFISAVDYSGNEGKSYAVFAEVKDNVPPATPVNLRVAADTGKMKLTWDANTEPDLAGYLIYRTTIGKERGAYSLITPNLVSGTTFTDKLHKNIRNKFSYKIVAIDSAFNKSDFSEEARANMPDVTPPVKPFIKDVYYEGNEIIIEWIPNADKDISGYDIFRIYKKDSVIRNEKINVNTISTTTNLFTDNWVRPNIKYKYYLVAIDSSGNRSRPSEVYECTLKNKESNIYESFDVKYKSNKRLVELNWELSAGSRAVIYRSEGNLSLKPITGILNENEYKDKSVEDGKSYTYQLRVFDTDNKIFKSELKTIFIE